MASYFHHISASTQAPTVLATFPFSRTPQGAHRDAKQLSCWPAISASLRSVIRSRDPKHSRPKTSRKTPRFVKWATNFRLLPYCASYPTRTALASLGNVGSQDRVPTGHDPPIPTRNPVLDTDGIRFLNLEQHQATFIRRFLVG